MTAGDPNSNSSTILSSKNSDQIFKLIEQESGLLHPQGNPDDRRWTIDIGRPQKFTLSTLCSGELKTKTSVKKVAFLGIK